MEVIAELKEESRKHSAEMEAAQQKQLEMMTYFYKDRAIEADAKTDTRIARMETWKAEQQGQIQAFYIQTINRAEPKHLIQPQYKLRSRRAMLAFGVVVPKAFSFRCGLSAPMSRLLESGVINMKSPFLRYRSVFTSLVNGPTRPSFDDWNVANCRTELTFASHGKKPSIQV